MGAESIIHDRGRGPEIRGTRITVFDILDHHPDKGWTPEQLAGLFRVSVEQIQAALTYIEEHRDEVMSSYQKMLDFAAKGDSPEVREKYAKSHARFMALKAELDGRKGATRDARAAG
jgi:uncharacterized protein (DUF433 family)